MSLERGPSSNSSSPSGRFSPSSLRRATSPFTTCTAPPSGAPAAHMASSPTPGSHMPAPPLAADTSTTTLSSTLSSKMARGGGSTQLLSALLVSALNAAAAEAHVGPPEFRDPNIAENLQLDAHRQVLSAFIEQQMAGPAYTPLLTQIKGALDATIRKGLQCGLTAQQLRAQLAELRQQQRRAAQVARSEVLAADAPVRQQLLSDIAAEQARLALAQRRADAAKRDLAAVKEELERLQVRQRAMRAEKASLVAAAAAEQEWMARPGVAGALALEVPDISAPEYQELLHEMAPGGHQPTSSSATDTNHSRGAAQDQLAAAVKRTPSSNQLHPLQEALLLLEKQDVSAAGRLLQHYTGTRAKAMSGASSFKSRPVSSAGGLSARLSNAGGAVGGGFSMRSSSAGELRRELSMGVARGVAAGAADVKAAAVGASDTKLSPDDDASGGGDDGDEV